MITGAMLRDAVISAANSINNNRKAVDALNVFPVPDGDTGTNMSMTMSAAAREVAILSDSVSAGEVASKTASALLRGARGNSGVILSLIFRGFAKAVKDCDEIDGDRASLAFKLGTQAAYSAVMKPTEGTILTVVRKASEKADECRIKGFDAISIWISCCETAQETLDETPKILPVLAKAGVVDAGGQGLVHVLNGMRNVFEGNGIVEAADGKKLEKPASPVAKAEGGESIKFGYCTEYIVNRTPDAKDTPIKLRAYLESIGDCVVVVDDETIIKVHAHSNEPGNVIQAGLRCGALTNIKIDNMRFQHNNIIESESPAAEPESEPVESAAPEKKFGFVSVAVGEGFEELFRELGADEIVSGGQTMNPSTDDILSAVLKTPAEHVFVLPNNKNIIMAAEQVSRLCDKSVSVLQTKTLPQGITAMLNFDDSLSANENHMNMMKAAEKVGTCLVTFAARDSEIEDKKVRKGEILGMENGKITVLEHNPVTAGYKTARHLCKKLDGSMITVFFGEGATQSQADELADMLRQRCNNVEVNVVQGGQPVYYFVISVE